MTLATIGNNENMKKIVEKLGRDFADYRAYRLTKIDVLQNDMDALSRTVSDVLKDAWKEGK
jgi:hypothetical protein